MCFYFASHIVTKKQKQKQNSVFVFRQSLLVLCLSLLVVIFNYANDMYMEFFILFYFSICVGCD